MTTRQTPDLQTFKLWAKTNAPVAKAVLMAQAYAELERERVDAYIAPILAKYAFKADGFDGRYLGEYPQGITNVRDLYLCGDEPGLKAFYADCDEAHRAHGFTGPQGHCPALRAENLLIEAQNALIEVAKPLFGIESHNLFGDNRKKYLNLLIGACLKEDK